MTSKIYIGIGSNSNNPLYRIQSAVDSLRKLGEQDSFCCSSLFQTPPMGPPQPNYLNGVCSFIYNCTATSLLKDLQSIERQEGRNRDTEIRWGQRPLDLDILLFGSEYIHDTQLIVPHPGLYSRAFVLTPLAELDPSLLLPNGQLVKNLAQSCSNPSIKKKYRFIGGRFEKNFELS